MQKLQNQTLWKCTGARSRENCRGILVLDAAQVGFFARVVVDPGGVGDLLSTSIVLENDDSAATAGRPGHEPARD